MSLPSSPHEYRGEDGASDFLQKEHMVSIWNEVLQRSSFLNKPLLPFEEWNIDFSELTVGTRVGIGKYSLVYSLQVLNVFRQKFKVLVMWFKISSY